MSRFWAAGGSSSESESSDDDSYSSDESVGKGQNKNRWAEMSDESGKSKSTCYASLLACVAYSLSPIYSMILCTHTS